METESQIKGNPELLAPGLNTYSFSQNGNQVLKYTKLPDMERDEFNNRRNEYLLRNFKKVQTDQDQKSDRIKTGKRKEDDSLKNNPVNVLIQTVKVLSAKGMSQRAISEHLKISLGTTNKFLNFE